MGHVYLNNLNSVKSVDTKDKDNIFCVDELVFH